MGPGKADVLEAIIAESWISGARRARGMSYRRAWLLVEEMNRYLDPVLIETLKSGGWKRGAKASATGGGDLVAYFTAPAHIAAVPFSPRGTSFQRVG